MRKSGLLFTAAAVSCLLAAGCSGGQKPAFLPSESCVYVADDGSVYSALVEPCEGITVDEEDLKQYLEAAVIRFNEGKGAAPLAENKKGEDPLPAALQSVKAEEEKLTAIFEYASAKDLIAFRQTADNEDDSSSITELHVVKTEVGANSGWFDGVSLLKEDGSEVSPEELSEAEETTVAAIKGGGTVMFSGSVLYCSEGAERKDEYTVKLPQGKRSIVVFK